MIFRIQRRSRSWTTRRIHWFLLSTFILLLPGWLFLLCVTGIPDNEEFRTYCRLVTVDIALDEYHREHGRDPDRNVGLTALQDVLGDRRYLRDGWNRPFLYRMALGKAEVLTLGADGKMGGAGINRDMTCEDARLWQTIWSELASDP